MPCRALSLGRTTVFHRTHTIAYNPCETYSLIIYNYWQVERFSSLCFSSYSQAVYCCNVLRDSTVKQGESSGVIGSRPPETTAPYPLAKMACRAQSVAESPLHSTTSATDPCFINHLLCWLIAGKARELVIWTLRKSCKRWRRRALPCPLGKSPELMTRRMAELLKAPLSGAAPALLR